jgi:hypothetical protein
MTASDHPVAPRVRPRFRKHPVEFLLGIFGDVRPEEVPTALLLAFNVFLLLTAYYLLKVAREPLILLGAGAEVKSYASVGQSVLLILVASFYGWLSAQVGRIALISFVTLFFAMNLGVFSVLGTRGVGARSYARHPRVLRCASAWCLPNRLHRRIQARYFEWINALGVIMSSS